MRQPDSETTLEQSELENTPFSKPETLSLAKPNSSILLFFLVLFSFGIYSCFWLVARVGELKLIRQNSMTPFLWFFVPLFFIAQLFAWPALVLELKRAQKDRGVAVWNAWRGGWVALAIITSIMVGVSEQVLANNVGVLFLSVAVWAFLILILDKQFTRLKKEGDGIILQPRSLVIRTVKIVVLVTSGVVFLATLYELVVKPLQLESVVIYNDGDHYQSAKLKVSFPFAQGGWRQVPVGSYSDGTAEVEFSGPVSASYLLVFKHDLSSSFSSIANFRMDNFAADYGPNKCKQHRALMDGQLEVISFVSCEGESLGTPIGIFVAVIKNEGHYIEVLGELTASRLPYRLNKRKIKEMLKQVRSYE